MGGAQRQAQWVGGQGRGDVPVAIADANCPPMLNSLRFQLTCPNFSMPIARSTCSLQHL